MTAENLSAQLIELERLRGEALIRRDAVALDTLWPADLMHIHSTGTVMERIS